MFTGPLTPLGSRVFTGPTSGWVQRSRPVRGPDQAVRRAGRRPSPGRGHGRRGHAGLPPEPPAMALPRGQRRAVGGLRVGVAGQPHRSPGRVPCALPDRPGRRRCRGLRPVVRLPVPEPAGGRRHARSWPGTSAPPVPPPARHLPRHPARLGRGHVVRHRRRRRHGGRDRPHSRPRAAGLHPRQRLEGGPRGRSGPPRQPRPGPDGRSPLPGAARPPGAPGPSRRPGGARNPGWRETHTVAP